jgi:hypothetical protein
MTTPLATTIRQSRADQQRYPFKTSACPTRWRPAVEPISFGKRLPAEPVTHDQASGSCPKSSSETPFSSSAWSSTRMSCALIRPKIKGFACEAPAYLCVSASTPHNGATSVALIPNACMQSIRPDRGGSGAVRRIGRSRSERFPLHCGQASEMPWAELVRIDCGC